MKEKIKQALELKNWAVLGASENPERISYQIVQRLQELDYQVYPVNPNCNEILGLSCYPDLKSIPDRVDVVDIVVNPTLGEKFLDHTELDSIQFLWFQPGSYNPALLKKALEKGPGIIAKACVLEETETDDH